MLPSSVIVRLQKCKWELIDIDIVACKLCGEEHVCGMDCDHTILSDYGVICEVTGVM